MSGLHLLDVLAARRGCYISASILPRSCAGWRCPTYAGWRKTPIRSINGRTRFVTSRGMNGSLPV